MGFLNLLSPFLLDLLSSLIGVPESLHFEFVHFIWSSNISAKFEMFDWLFALKRIHISNMILALDLSCSKLKMLGGCFDFPL